MNHIHPTHLYCFILLFIHHLNGAFIPNKSDYDAYGIKIDMNDNFLVLAQNNNQTPAFLLQFAPYNDTQKSTQCFIDYPNTTNMFMYTVVVGKKQDQTQFFFAGEMINGQNGPFVGFATDNNISGSTNIFSNASSSCNTSFTYFVQPLTSYGHQEYYILDVEPSGNLAYGFSNQFIFTFDSRNFSIFNTSDENSIWPDASFIPHAVDISDGYGVIAGFIRNAANATVIYSPMIYLINFNASEYDRPVFVHDDMPMPNAGTWQDLLTNSDANVYSAKYDMSVSIDKNGNVLVGMQFINRVFLYSVNIMNATRLTYVSRHTNGRTLGNGKNVAWFDNGIAAILINTYSLSYVWSSSQIFLFDTLTSGYNSTSLPLSVFPNSNQLLPQRFSSVFLNIVTSSSSLALLDNQGTILIFTPTQPGYYPSVVDTGTSPYTTIPQICMPGAYKNQSGIHDCILCPISTRNPGNFNIQCIPCSSGAFCPLGSVADVSKTALDTAFQVTPYPQSPESTVFDEILIHNMFTIRSGRCVLISPLFWALMIAGLAIIIIIIMEILKYCAKNPKSQKIRKIFKYTFKHTDLIREGEAWVGGLASFSIIVLVSCAFAFSGGYLKQYPIETSADFNFACEKSIRNAKFDTYVQSLAIPFAHEEQEVVHLLNNQSFILNIDFINTLINCDAISLQALLGLTWTTIRWDNCNNTNSILTLNIPLRYQQISVQVLIADVKTMGGVRIGLTGPGVEREQNKLRELNFHKSYSKDENILARNLPVAIAITKVINETKPMVGEESTFSGIYVPTFTVDMNSLFVSNDQYIRSALTLTTLTFDITETPYYVKNVQQPIVRLSEVIFRNLLFSMVCLEIFGLVFLLYKLVVKPIYQFIIRKRLSNLEKKPTNEKQTNGHIKTLYNLSNIDEDDYNHISSRF